MDIQMITTYIVTDIFCMIMAITMGNTYGKDIGSEFEIKSMKKSICSFCLFMVAGLLGLLMENRILPPVNWLIWVSNMVSLFMLISVTFYWFLFASSKVNSPLVSEKRKISIAAVPLVLSGILCFTTPLTGWVFRITKTGEYQRGPLFLVLASMGIFYHLLVLFTAVIQGLRTEGKENKKKCRIIALYILFPFTASVLQIQYSGMPILAPAIMTGYFLVFSSLQEEQINTDALTGLNNRRSASRYLREQIHHVTSKGPVAVYMMDLNGFKQINDNYGHVEGDHALRLFAEVLKMVGNEKSLFVSRYGGDEFLMIGREENPEKADQLIAEIKETLERMVLKDKRPYEMTVSVGYCFESEAEDTMEKLIGKADRALYQEKQRIKRGKLFMKAY